jgi:NhaA family Na+:H+ antiporter
LSQSKKGLVNLLQEFSVPLIAGVFCALAAANMAPEWYHHWFGVSHGGDGDPVFALPGAIFGHHLTLNFLINDVFMVFFFGIAAKEITEAALPGGSLNPLKTAINPLCATLGGVVGPIGVFFLAVMLAGGAGIYDTGNVEQMATVQRGWGIPTATDIALAWLVARAVFGKGHPAINFLLLLAVADDAIGLGIIAIFYGDPLHPAEPAWLGLVVAGMAAAFVMRKLKVASWVPYIAVAGPLAWSGLILARLHPALALVFIVPFLPGPQRDKGMFVEAADEAHVDHSPLHQFEHSLKGFVDFGLFFFAMGNAGVVFAGIGAMTWIILGALVVGKTVGIFVLGMTGRLLGFPLPAGMTVKDLTMAGFIAALGLTVALFVAGAAFPSDLALQSEAKMGALFSGFVGLVAILLGRMFGIGWHKQGAAAVSAASVAAPNDAGPAPDPPAALSSTSQPAMAPLEGSSGTPKS